MLNQQSLNGKEVVVLCSTCVDYDKENMMCNNSKVVAAHESLCYKFAQHGIKGVNCIHARAVHCDKEEVEVAVVQEEKSEEPDFFDLVLKATTEPKEYKERMAKKSLRAVKDTSVAPSLEEMKKAFYKIKARYEENNSYNIWLYFEDFNVEKAGLGLKFNGAVRREEVIPVNPNAQRAKIPELKNLSFFESFFKEKEGERNHGKA